MDKKKPFGLFSTEEHSEQLYIKLHETKRLFHRKEIADAFVCVFTSLLEAEKKVIELENTILLSWPGDLDYPEREATEMALVRLHNTISGSICSLDSFGWAFTLSEEGKKKRERIDQAIAAANDYEGLVELLNVAIQGIS